MKKCVIVGGADIRDYGRIRGLLTEEMVFIFCDSGLRHLEALGRKPDLIVGDFDSIAMEELGLYMAGAKRRDRKEAVS
jgi:thiamine pyrophosphokinase